MRIKIFLFIAVSLALNTAIAQAPNTQPATGQVADYIMKSGSGHKVNSGAEAVVTSGDLNCTMECLDQFGVKIDKVNCTTIDGKLGPINLNPGYDLETDQIRYERALIRRLMGYDEKIKYQLGPQLKGSSLSNCSLHVTSFECRGPSAEADYTNYKCQVTTSYEEKSSKSSTHPGRSATAQ